MASRTFAKMSAEPSSNFHSLTGSSSTRSIRNVAHIGRWSDTASEAALSSLSNTVTSLVPCQLVLYFFIKRPSGRANRGRYMTYPGISASHRPLFVGSIHLFTMVMISLAGGAEGERQATTAQDAVLDTLVIISEGRPDRSRHVE